MERLQHTAGPALVQLATVCLTVILLSAGSTNAQHNRNSNVRTERSTQDVSISASSSKSRPPPTVGSSQIPAANPNFEAAFQGECRPKASKQNPCEHLCLDLHDGTYECTCFHGFTLAVDGYSCTKLVYLAASDNQPPTPRAFGLVPNRTQETPSSRPAISLNQTERKPKAIARGEQPSGRKSSSGAPPANRAEGGDENNSLAALARKMEPAGNGPVAPSGRLSDRARLLAARLNGDGSSEEAKSFASSDATLELSTSEGGADEEIGRNENWPPDANANSRNQQEESEQNSSEVDGDDQDDQEDNQDDEQTRLDVQTSRSSGADGNEGRANGLLGRPLSSQVGPRRQTERLRERWNDNNEEGAKGKEPTETDGQWIKYDTDTPADGAASRVSDQDADQQLPTMIEFSDGGGGKPQAPVPINGANGPRARRLSEAPATNDHQEARDYAEGAQDADKSEPNSWRLELDRGPALMIESIAGRDGLRHAGLEVIEAEQDDDGDESPAGGGNGPLNARGLDYDLSVLESLVGKTMGDYYSTAGSQSAPAELANEVPSPLAT